MGNALTVIFKVTSKHALPGFYCSPTPAHKCLPTDKLIIGFHIKDTEIDNPPKQEAHGTML